MGEIAGVRWARALLAGFLAELLLSAVAAGLYFLPDPETALKIGIPPASFVAFVIFGFWAARPATGRFALHGLLAAILGIALYFALILGALSLPGAPEMDFSELVAPISLLAHGLKLVGGWLGGTLAARASAKS
jgi:hypothetical protein